jgi:hypothetical protein
MHPAILYVVLFAQSRKASGREIGSDDAARSGFGAP